MALILSFDKTQGTGRLQPTQVVAKAKVFSAEDGRPVLQIDTTGSESRENPGKQSQTFQLSETAAQQLFQILSDTFGFKS